jgi:hypothetical protein
MNISPSLYPTSGVNIITETTTNNASTTTTKNEYFIFKMKNLDYQSNIRRIKTRTGSFLSVLINALCGPTDSPTYVRFDATVAGEEAKDLISRCQKAVDED